MKLEIKIGCIETVAHVESAQEAAELICELADAIGEERPTLESIPTPAHIQDKVKEILRQRGML